MPPMPPELALAFRICQYLSDQMQQNDSDAFAPIWNDKEITRAALGMTQEEFDAGVQCAIDQGWLMVRDVPPNQVQ